jgi:hypothetical protein
MRMGYEDFRNRESTLDATSNPSHRKGVKPILNLDSVPKLGVERVRKTQRKMM